VTRLSPLQVANLWVSSGGPVSAVPEAVAYAFIESGYDTAAVSPTGCCDVWQLCPCQGSTSANASAAVAKWKACNGGSFDCDWTPYDGGISNPQWAKGYADGQAAAAQLGTTGATTPTSNGSNQQGGISDLGTALSGLGTSAQAVQASASNKALAVGAILAGGILLAVGAWFVAGQTDAGRAMEANIKSGVRDIGWSAVMAPK
jgi:hypothetical protein